MDLTKILTAGTIMVVLAYAYSRLNDSVTEGDLLADYRKLEEYLLNNSSLAKSNLPILWIHIPHEVNARNWESFYSRTNDSPNQPYLYLTIKSIIEKCGKDFNVCLIDDDSFAKILPGWTVDMDRVSDPHKSSIRLLAMLRILLHYGGAVLPPSLYCRKSLSTAINHFFDEDRFFAADMRNESVSAENTDVAPSLKIMGCKRNNKECAEFISYLERIVSQDNTEAIKFEGKASSYIEKQYRDRSIDLLDAGITGTVDASGRLIGIEELLGQSNIALPLDNHAIYLPTRSILTRLNYRWFARLPVSDVLTSNTFIGVTMMRDSHSD